MAAAAVSLDGPADRPLREDHRIRVGRERRERMRRHLLQSILQVCSQESRRGPAVIDDVVKHAQVSRGTFYTYFDSLDQGVAELGAQLADEMTQGIGSVYEVLTDPVLRTATGFQMFLIRSLLDPAWGAFIARIGLLSDDNLLTRKVRDDIALGVEAGDYQVPSVNDASDLLMGTKVEAIQRLIKERGSLAYVQGMTSLVLRSFGVDPARADRSVAVAFERLCQEAPGTIDWWRDPRG